MNDEKARALALEKACQLAFGKSNDVVKLAFMDGEDMSAIDSLDLSSLSAIHRLSNGSVELKLTDKAKLIELILAATEASGGGEQAAAGLIGAINAAAEKLTEGGAVESLELQ